MQTTVAIFLGAILSASFAIGLFLCRRPVQAIRLQQRFYEKINWRMEPVSWDTEVRNTRIMGIFLLACVFITGLYLSAKIYTVYFK